MNGLSLTNRVVTGLHHNQTVKQFTPGPWEAKPNGDFVQSSNGQPVELTPANLAVAAAAPQMFTALEQIIGCLVPANGKIDPAAIERARQYAQTTIQLATTFED